MSKIAILIPRESIKNQALSVINKRNLTNVEVLVDSTTETVSDARACIENGVEIIIARGIQASLVRNYTKIPVVEIVLTGQEISYLIYKAKRLTKKEKPTVAIIGFKNMFSDISHFDEIFDINLKFYNPESTDQFTDFTEKAIEEGADVLIGGNIVEQVARVNNVPFQYIDSSEESISNALDTAIKMQYMAETIKNHTAEVETIFDSSLQGIIKIDNSKKITIVNKVCEELLNISNENVIDREIAELLPDLKDEYIDSILNGSRDVFNTSLRIKDVPAMVTIVPIQESNQIFGAIATFYKLNLGNYSNNESRSLYLRGYMTDSRFSELDVSDDTMRRCVDNAKVFALSKYPVLINGEVGTEKEFFAQCIHNNSAYKNGPFVSINCSGMTEEKQLKFLFGHKGANEENSEKGAFEVATHGTLLISDIDKLSPICQYRLYRALKYKVLIQNDIEKSHTLEVRIIVTTSKNLSMYVENGEFRQDLYYALNGLVLNIPPVRERQTVIKNFVLKKAKEFTKEYSKFIKISDEAMRLIMDFEWNGNMVQLESFCERIFLSTNKKLITEGFVENILSELYPKIEIADGNRKIVVYKSPEAERISDLIARHGGNRSAVAKELNISTTTLWRRMKKFGIME